MQQQQQQSSSSSSSSSSSCSSIGSINIKTVIAPQVIKVIDEEKLLAALEADTAAARDCWHAIRVLHRHRRSGSSTAVIEGWNSVASWLADARQGIDLSHTSNRLKLNLSGITAVGGADEGFVEAVARHVECFNPLKTKAGGAYIYLLQVHNIHLLKHCWCTRPILPHLFANFPLGGQLPNIFPTFYCSAQKNCNINSQNN